MVTEKQLENLKKGKATQFRTGEEQARIGNTVKNLLRKRGKNGERKQSE